MTDDIYDSLDKMIDLCERKIKTMKELKRALRLADVLGIPAKNVKGPMRVGVYEGHSYFRPWTSATLKITYDGEDREFPLMTVHKELWPADILQAYEREQKRMKRRTAS